MMGDVRVLLTSILCEKDNAEANLSQHVALLEKARAEGCDLAVFPEFSLTGSVDPATQPHRAVTLDNPLVKALVAATGDVGVPALFGIAELDGARFHISQLYAAAGRIVGVQRKRHLGEGEEPYAASSETAQFRLGPTPFATVICAEGHVDFTWDAARAGGAEVVFFCSAPGLYGRRTDDESWRTGFEWWNTRGLGDARAQARRSRFWVAMSTQAGAAYDEDFPGIAALVDPGGTVVERLPDWRPGTLVVDIPDGAER